MKKLLFIFQLIAIMLLSFTMFASVVDTSHVVANAINESYTITMLFGLSIMGILLHWLVDLKKAQSQDVACTMGHYVQKTWISSLISLIICSIAIMVRHELNKIPDFSAWEGGAMVTIGYMGDSLLPLVFGFAKSKGVDVDAIKK